MQIANVANQDDQKKVIWAILLGVVAIVFLWWTFFGFGGNSTATPNRRPVVAIQTGAAGAVSASVRQQLDNKTDLLDQFEEWRDKLPPSLANNATAEALDAVLELRGHVEDLQAVELPKGFGRD